jgi:hypothetical protein
MFETFDKFPQRPIQRSWHAHFFTPMHDRSIHEIHFRLPLGEDVLEHAGTVLAGSVCALLYKLTRIAMQFNSQRGATR